MGNRLVGCACVLWTACVSPSTPERATPIISVGGDSPLVELFTRVGSETGVPAELLATLAHVETRFRIADDDGHGSHGRGARGLLGLGPDEIVRGARLAGVTDDAARIDVEANLRAGAALLRDASPDARTLDELVAALHPALRREVTAALGRGVDGRDVDGHSIVIAARTHLSTGFGTTTQALGYPGAEWVPASPQNYDTANRDVGDIENVVIHTTQGSFSGTLGWFQNPAAKVSSHYVVRSNDGHVAQMVAEQNVAWHDKCFNTRTLGIEHEGKVEQPELWYTEAMYLESAKLTAYLCDKYGIAKELGPIVGHGDAPDCSDHTDPGDGWNWDHYLDLVRTGGAPRFDAGDVVVELPTSVTSGDRATVIVTITNRGNTTWDLDLTRLGTTEDRESAFFVDGDWLSTNRATGIDARTLPGETGTFTFDIVAPAVGEPTVLDETFRLVEEGVAWFGPEIHVVTRVIPHEPMTGGCSTTGAGSSAFACAILALGVTSRRRRRTARRL